MRWSKTASPWAPRPIFLWGCPSVGLNCAAALVARSWIAAAALGSLGLQRSQPPVLEGLGCLRQKVALRRKTWSSSMI